MRRGFRVHEILKLVVSSQGPHGTDFKHKVLKQFFLPLYNFMFMRKYQRKGNEKLNLACHFHGLFS